MACKFIRKLMLMMMGLFILVLLKVQASDLSYIDLHPSSPPTLPPHVPKLDKVQTNDRAPMSFCPSPQPIWYPQSSEIDETLHTCIDMFIKFCDSKWPDRSLSEDH